ACTPTVVAFHLSNARAIRGWPLLLCVVELSELQSVAAKASKFGVAISLPDTAVPGLIILRRASGSFPMSAMTIRRDCAFAELDAAKDQDSANAKMITGRIMD
ncbi:hypothetical protein NZK35_31675, partial [Stieleria sp. ICT_E10.1]|uniref:hypothetical protein n=1 Tax=Stieleria sedimenti TaxID=2976331 RepID=UPI0021801C15